MGTHPIFESDFDCLTEIRTKMTEQETPTVTETPTVVPTEAPAMETEAVEEAFGDVNMLAIEDLISELVTVGPHFDKIQSFLAPFQLASAGGTMKKKDQVISFAKGGVNGDRGEKINELLRKMT